MFVTSIHIDTLIVMNTILYPFFGAAGVVVVAGVAAAMPPFHSYPTAYMILQAVSAWIIRPLGLNQKLYHLQWLDWLLLLGTNQRPVNDQVL